MNDFLLGLVAGVVIGWLIEYLIYRQFAEARAHESGHALKVAQILLADRNHEINAQAAEINALRNRLAEAQAVNESNSGVRAEADRLRAELDAAKTQLIETSEALDSATTSAQEAVVAVSIELEEYRTKLANYEAQIEMNQGAVPNPDDLKRIEGIGPKVSNTLIAGGIRTFAQLASSTPDRLRQVLRDGGMSRINDPGTWAEQAALAAVGDWDALEKLQDELVGGRRV